MKNKSFQRLSAQLHTVFKYKNWEMLWQVHLLVQNWSKIVDESVAAKTRPAYIQKNILWIYVADSMWMQHLQTMQPELLKKVCLFLPDTDISAIRWLMQPLEPAADVSTAKQQPKTPPAPEEKKAFTELASTVENRDCRKALCRLWNFFHDK